MLCLSLISVVDSRLQETALVLDMELRDWAGKPGRILGVNCLLLMDFAKAGGKMIGTSKNCPKNFRFFMTVYIEGCIERCVCMCVCV